MKAKRWNVKRWVMAAATGVLLLPLILYGRLHFLRPSQTSQTRSLFPGITYRRDFRLSPRPMMIHIVAIDLSTPGVRAFVTPGMVASDKTELNAQTTSAFLTQFDLQVAVNAGFFYPFREQTPWDYYPRSGDRVNVVGQAISNGTSYSPAEPEWAVLCFSADDRAQVLSSGVCPRGTMQAVAGNAVLVERGNPVELRSDLSSQDAPYSRLAVAIDKTGQKLWLVAIDGKQPLYSEGATLAELTDIVMELGADAALNLDGGGSTTLVTATPSGATLLNAPIHAKIPLLERPIANHLGFYAPVQDEKLE